VAYIWGKANRQSRVGGVKFSLGPVLSAPSKLKLGSASGTLWLAVDVEGVAKDNQPIGTVRVRLADGSVQSQVLRYGQHLRAPSDPRITLYSERTGSLCAMPIDLPKRAVSIEVIPADNGTHLRLSG